MKIKIASAQYPIGFYHSWPEYALNMEHWVQRATQQQADVLVFPEYASMELTSLFAKAVYQNLAKQLHAMQSILDKYISLHQHLAKKHHCLILAGSFPVAMQEAVYHNRAFLFYPDGQYDYQDKLIMTRFECEQWCIHKGQEIKLFASDYGKLAINICYDSEFPLFARQQAEAGAVLILAPSCTDTLAGYHRVRIGCQARALENQCYVVHATTVGTAAWSPAVDENIGAAAVYTPVDQGFPDNGILAKGELNQAQWLYANLDLSDIDKVRKTGRVLNYRDWPQQYDVYMNSI